MARYACAGLLMVGFLMLSLSSYANARAIKAAPGNASEAIKADPGNATEAVAAAKGNATHARARGAAPAQDTQAHQGVWKCDENADVAGTDIQVLLDLSLTECKDKCDSERECTFISYQPEAQAHHDRQRCVLKKDWNDGGDGVTGPSDGMTWCCDKSLINCTT